MPIPVVVPSGPLTITEAESLSGEQLLAAFAQLLAAGSAGSTTVTPLIPLPVYPNPGGGPPATNPLILDTEQKQTMYRHLCIAIAHSVILQSEVSVLPSADKIPRADGSGLLNYQWLPWATAVYKGALRLSSAPSGIPTALSSEEVTTTPTANLVPRADGAGHIAYGWIVPDVFNGALSPGPGGGNKVFTTASNFRAGTTRLYMNGSRQSLGSAYTETGANEVTFSSAPGGGATLLIDYSPA